ncbi:UNVERIFIED_CONTAM: Cytochrome c oxidase subunit [Sesamum calycinum]|uniref:Cytochrome c oxidase subunit n=1 Tax=Sesamum calycinum TaxID=2727403 RepID=A0AAW2J951_9LAMI
MIESQRHSYHLVDPSPWPISGSLGALATTVGGTLFLIICGIRQYLGHLTKEHHVGFEAAACGEPIDHSGPSNAGPSNVAPTDSPRGSFPSVPSSLTPIPSDPSSQRTQRILFDGFDASGSLRMPENNDSFAIPDFIPSQEQVMGLGTILVDPFRASNQTSTRPFSEQSCWKGKQAIEEWETQKVVAGSSTPGGAKMSKTQKEFKGKDTKRRPQAKEIPKVHDAKSKGVACPPLVETSRLRTVLRSTGRFVESRNLIAACRTIYSMSLKKREGKPIEKKVGTELDNCRYCAPNPLKAIEDSCLHSEGNCILGHFSGKHEAFAHIMVRYKTSQHPYLESNFPYVITRCRETCEH